MQKSSALSLCLHFLFLFDLLFDLFYLLRIRVAHTRVSAACAFSAARRLSRALILYHLHYDKHYHSNENGSYKSCT